jgi:MoaA/NifB/PqqE/SkfB family radical SAM enzyme
MGFTANYACNLASLALGREPVRPLLASYYVTHRCTLNCIYCSDGSGRPFKVDPAEELSTADAKRLLFLLARATDTLDFTGGEPLMRDDLEELLAFAREQGARTVLNTKGLGLIDRPNIMKHCDVLVISLDAMDTKALAEIIGADESEARGIHEVVQYAIAHRSVTGARVVLSAVAMPGYLKETRKVLDFAMERKLGFQPSPCIDGTVVRAGLKSSEEYRKLVSEMIARKRAGGIVFGTRRYLEGIRNMEPFRCHPLLMPTIRPDGRLYYPCLESGQASVSVLEAGSYPAALDAARRAHDIPRCRERCHIFCHMGLSLLQRHPAAALRELKLWRSQRC